MTLFILYVASQESSTAFYRNVLAAEPTLNVPGMTEFSLPGGGELGLMPSFGIRRLLGDDLPDPHIGHGIPRCEVYLRVHQAHIWYQRAIDAGAITISPLQMRDWGDQVAYCQDMDGHVLAFCESLFC